MDQFDLLGALPEHGSTTVLEASAGTGKTFTLAALVTRYVAEGRARLDQMLLITFSRAATQELRERVRNALQEALRAFDDPELAQRNDVLAALTDGAPADLAERRHRLRDALAGFDAATIATTHQFCHLVLKSLGVAGDTDSHVTLAESLDELVAEIVDDLYLAHFGQEREQPPISRGEALKLGREVVANPGTELRPLDPTPGSQPAVRVGFATDVLAELDRRKRRRGILSYDDLLGRLADALESAESPAATRMHQRWSVVMVDEFQDTDPVQWQVIERAFSGQSTLILIGDPKQAIYAFRGGDIVTYLHAAKTAGQRRTLGMNWRSDAVLVDRLQNVLGGAELGDPDIKVLPVQAHHRGHRLAGAPHNDPFRLRVVSRERFGQRGTRTIRMDALRPHVAADLASDIAVLLASTATFDGRPLQANDIAVITESHADARACFDALVTAGVPAVYTGDTDVLKSHAADDWLSLLEAFDQLHRPGLVRAAATTMFFGRTAEDLAAGGDALTDRIADTLRQWADHAREAGVAAVFEAAQLAGMGGRVLSWAGGERNMTDLAHVTQLLHEVSHREQLSLTALRDWLRSQREERSGAPERNRRLDSDAAAVQIMTVWVSKGLQFPIVYLPFTFNRYVRSEDLVRFHDRERRCLHVGGDQSAELATAQRLGRQEAAGEETRLTYVAMTRAQSQVVAWWAPSWDEPNGGLSRLLRGRRPGQSTVPDRCDPERVDDADAMALLRQWETAGGPVLEESIVADPVELATKQPREDLGVRHFHRGIDTTWRRTSYSGLIRAAETTGVGSEPEVIQLDDEVADIAVSAPPSGADVPSPMADLPTGATFGSLVHAVLETADPFAADLATELKTQIDRHSVWWPVDVDAADLAAALVPMHDTSLGPLAGGLTLRQIGLRDRLCEMDFEFPLSGGDRGTGRPETRLADVGRLLSEHLPADDPLAPYVERLSGGPLGVQSLRGYLSGSVDAVLRIPDGAGDRYLVVDYKTNWLGEADRLLSAADYDRERMAEAMLHSDYPLQALLYSVVLHRFLRWRQPGYQPERHLGGVLYLFVRGMCGPDTPTADGHPAGVFSWRPPTALVTAVSDLLDGPRVAT
ncbi:exodeoxyribonuclease V subunit beta [Mycolicibacterium aichiense]|uniref:RecBCD enzyme subunit RecB n=1 Tax=Mycolicibacterium aichiense TaxID=1799 RepID=A0AAD1HT76_9MYCO|nr:exodeoxyribonuclease V subunit beta [Mycolicibacterium aichiense]MCV7016843.1 exodeoxyribonuclease V subunit beta [Mycolicibacterium aichiense]BBX10735.1 RecBCD enzyme subunit RecB [Mycolicibacterium aichiense]STZ25608.1 exodeoxyribonuclease V subunit beta [Mycolicibacterium aichiense]